MTKEELDVILKCEKLNIPTIEQEKILKTVPYLEEMTMMVRRTLLSPQQKQNYFPKTFLPLSEWTACDNIIMLAEPFANIDINYRQPF
jgi:hypothetical protein